MSRTSYTLSSVKTEISKLSLSRTELSQIQKAFEDPIIARKLSTTFEDPIIARKFIESFEVPVFRKNFFNDPIIALNKITEPDGMGRRL